MKKKNEFNYFDEFAKSANLAREAATELKKYILDFNSTTSEAEMKKIHEIENKADRNLHELKNYLLKDFLPPIDREDILEISYSIDDLVDGIDEVVIDINIFNITKVTQEIKTLITLLEKATGIVYELVIEFKNFKKVQEIKDKVIEVNRIEEQADRLYEKSIRDLYRNDKEPVQVIKWTNIYGTIENCFDACEEIAECIDNVLVKNS